MKTLLRRTAYNSFALFLLPLFIQGVHISGGVMTYIVGGLVFSLISLFIKPVLHFMTVPLNFATFGTFSFVINAILFYILTVFVIDIQIKSFTFTGFSYAGFIIPRMYINTVFAYVVTALALAVIETFLNWITER
jgi:putative membrane protein